MSNSKRNFYELLNASSTATFNELKSNYKQLILQCHPDKLQQQQFDVETNKLNINEDPNNIEFVAITEAWNCLKDPLKRKQYDAELLLNKFHTHNNIYAHIKLSEMKKQPNIVYDGEGEELDLKKSAEDEEIKYVYTYDCRCGGQYIVDESAEQCCCSSENNDVQINKSENNGTVDNNNGDDDDDDDKCDADKKSISGSTIQSNKNSPNNIKVKSNSTGCGGGGGGSEGVVQENNDDVSDGDGDYEVDNEGGGELIVECSECSLVIILNG